MWNDFVFNPKPKMKKIHAMQEWTHGNDEKMSKEQLDPMEEINQIVLQKLNFEGEEQGMYHPMHHQTIRLKNNEMIDIFVDKDNGIRLDPHSQSFNTFANEYKLHIHNYTAWISGYHKQSIKGHYLAVNQGQYWRHSYGDIGFVGEREWRQEVKGNQHNLVYKNDYQTVDGSQIIVIGKDQTIHIKGNATVKVEQNAKIDVGGAFSVNAGSVDIRARGNVRIDGSRIDIG
jgi:hypothetical protein